MGGTPSAWLPLKISHQRSKTNIAQNSHRFQMLTPSIFNSPHKCKPRIDGCRHSHWMKYAAQAVPARHRRSKYARPCPVPRADLVLCQLAHANVHDATFATYSPLLLPHRQSYHGITSPYHASSASSDEMTAFRRPEGLISGDTSTSQVYW